MSLPTLPLRTWRDNRHPRRELPSVHAAEQQPRSGVRDVHVDRGPRAVQSRGSAGATVAEGHLRRTGARRRDDVTPTAASSLRTFPRTRDTTPVLIESPRPWFRYCRKRGPNGRVVFGEARPTAQRATRKAWPRAGSLGMGHTVRSRNIQELAAQSSPHRRQFRAAGATGRGGGLHVPAGLPQVGSKAS